MLFFEETAVIIPIPKTLQFVCTQFAAGGLGFVLDWRRRVIDEEGMRRTAVLLTNLVEAGKRGVARTGVRPQRQMKDRAGAEGWAAWASCEWGRNGRLAILFSGIHSTLAELF
ncbi:MAG: hypothetical protein IAF02_21065 [Anaerolineae bacterium]|nr:hypothetical protein [Anaerolineae bacterium]